MAARIIHQTKLKHFLHYDPETGVFTRLIFSGGQHPGPIVANLCSNGYVHISIARVRIRAHRLAFIYMTGTCPAQVDHINGIRTDNRWKNLRASSYTINAKNAKRRMDNKSGISGVRARNGGWQVQISSGPRKEYLGQFRDFFEACCARKSAEHRLGFHPNHGRPL